MTLLLDVKARGLAIDRKLATLTPPATRGVLTFAQEPAMREGMYEVGAVQRWSAG
jgi:hypothetical protein